MKSLEIEFDPERNIALDFFCLECEEKSSNEIDLDFNFDSELYSNCNVLHCLKCEAEYEYNIVFDSKKIIINLNNDKLDGSLKYSDKVCLEEYESWSPYKSKRFYFNQIKNLLEILDLKIEDFVASQALKRLVFVGVITSLETYLNDIYIQIVFDSDETLEKFINKYEIYQREKISLHELMIKYKSINNRVKEDIENIVYHNIPKLIKIYNIYNFEIEKFEKLDEISRFIKIRHKLIHRSGLDENNNFKEVYKKEILSLIDSSNLFVEYIDNKISNKCYLDYNYLDF